MKRLDASDLALIEVNLCKTKDLKARALIQSLVEEVRWYRRENERLEEKLRR